MAIYLCAASKRSNPDLTLLVQVSERGVPVACNDVRATSPGVQVHLENCAAVFANQLIAAVGPRPSQSGHAALSLHALSCQRPDDYRRYVSGTNGVSSPHHHKTGTWNDLPPPSLKSGKAWVLGASVQLWSCSIPGSHPAVVFAMLFGCFAVHGVHALLLITSLPNTRNRTVPTSWS